MTQNKNRQIEAKRKAWLLSFLDLMMLMLTFFIMLYAMRTPEMKIFSPSTSLFPPEKITQFEKVSPFRRGIHLNYLNQILIQRIGIPAGWFLQKEKDVLMIGIPVDVFTDTERKILSVPDEKRFLTLGEFFNNISNHVELLVNNEKNGILLASAIANTLKKGGMTSPIPVLTSTKEENIFLQIMIYPSISGEKQ